MFRRLSVSGDTLHETTNDHSCYNDISNVCSLWYPCATLNIFLRKIHCKRFKRETTKNIKGTKSSEKNKIVKQINQVIYLIKVNLKNIIFFTGLRKLDQILSAQRSRGLHNKGNNKLKMLYFIFRCPNIK